MRRINKFLALPPGERALALEVALSLTAAAVLLAARPFRQAVRSGSGAGGGQADSEMIEQIGRAVERAARHLPWRPLCLPQALAARAMLRRRGVACTLHFGMRLAPPDRAMQAHAWVTAGSCNVVGGKAADGFTELTRFPS